MSKFFIDEDKILIKAMNKLSHLMISRNISHEEERNELVKCRKKFKKELKKEFKSKK